MSMMAEIWEEAGTKFAGFMFTCVMFQQFFPDFLRNYLERLKDRLMSYFFPYVQITFHEYSASSGFKRTQAYTAIETYLGSKSTNHSRRIVGELVKKRDSVVLSMDAREEIVDVFEGVEAKWFLMRVVSNTKSISWYPNENEKK